MGGTHSHHGRRTLNWNLLIIRMIAIIRGGRGIALATEAPTVHKGLGDTSFFGGIMDYGPYVVSLVLLKDSCLRGMGRTRSRLSVSKYLKGPRPSVAGGPANRTGLRFENVHSALHPYDGVPVAHMDTGIGCRNSQVPDLPLSVLRYQLR